jgi:hypothetical protein
MPVTGRGRTVCSAGGSTVLIAQIVRCTEDHAIGVAFQQITDRDARLIASFCLARVQANQSRRSGSQADRRG